MNFMLRLFFIFCTVFIVPIFGGAEVAQVSSTANQQAINQMLIDTGRSAIMGESDQYSAACVNGVHTVLAKKAKPLDFVVVTRRTDHENPLVGQTATALAQFNAYLNQASNKNLKDLMNAVSKYGPNAVYALAELILVSPAPARAISDGWKKEGKGKQNSATAFEKLKWEYQNILTTKSQMNICQHTIPVLLNACNKVFACQINVNGYPSTDLKAIFGAEVKNVQITVTSIQPKSAK